MKELKPGILESKKHFDILDGLRGVAALAVVIFHFMEWVHSDYSKNFIGHGFLAVDFFFCLSGFVIGYAYDDRMSTLGTREFFKSRLIRLHPLVILGSLLGLIGFYLDPFSTSSELYNTGRIALIFLCSVLLIPFPVMEDRFFNCFGLNAPAWSLFWEYIANILYAFVLCKMHRRYLYLIAIASAVALGFVAHSERNLLGGWSGPTFLHGGARVAWSFTIGLLIYRSNWIIANKLGFIGVSIFLFAAFVMPWFSRNWLAELLVVLFYFPLMVSLGAGAVLKPGLKKLCVLSGKLSYPLYMTHYAAIWIFGNYFIKYKPAGMRLTAIIGTGTIALLGFAYLVMVLYDEPIRKYFTNKRKQRVSK